MTELIKYDAMCQAIEAAYEVDEVKKIRDKALAMEVYFKQANNVNAELIACEIRLRAERKAGQLLRKSEKAKGTAGAGRPRKGGRSVRPPKNEDVKTLAEHGISKTKSSRWQRMGDVSDEEFEAKLASGKKPTTSGIIGKPNKVIPDKPIWLWGRLRDFERMGLLEMTSDEATELMPPVLMADVKRLAPLVSAWLKELSNDIGRTKATRASVKNPGKASNPVATSLVPSEP